MYENQYAPKDAGNTPLTTFKDFVGALRILDAGCGTGNYIPSLQDMGARSITGLEFNPGMLDQCKTKVGGADGVELVLGSILDLESKLQPKSFDFVMSNVVMHHLDDEDSMKNDYANTRQAIQQCFHSLHGEGSTFYISTGFQTAMKAACWEFSHFPSSQRIIEQRYHDFEWWEDRLLAAGFQHVERHTIG